MKEGPAALGRRVARELLAVGRAFPRPPLCVRTLANHLGIEVLTHDSPAPVQPGLHCEYQPCPPRIILYASAVAVGRALPCPPHAAGQLEDLHIAHEIFHHLQAAHRFAALSLAEEEEAAHAFAREVCSLA
jgi:hypothetical protein